MEKNTAKVRFRFTTNRLLASTCPAGKDRVYVYDTDGAGLVLCVTANGTKTFYVYRRVQGRPTRIKLGRFPDLSLDQARKLAAAASGKIAQGIDPQEEKRRAARQQRDEATFEDLFHAYLEQHAKPHKKTWKEDERQVNYYLSSWKSRRLSTITAEDVEALHVRVGKEHGPYTANRLLALLHRLYSWKKVSPNPAHGIRKFPEKSRERFLQADELPRFFQALDEEPSATMRDYFYVSLYTGARRGNVQAMRWEEVHLDRGVWCIPETKNGAAVTLPLSPEAVEILKKRKAAAGACPWVFPGRGKTGHLMAPRLAWQRLLDRAGLADLRIHDLRRTLGSWQAAAGVSTTIIGKSLGHKPGSAATAIYARLDLDPVRAAVNTATAAMRAAASGSPNGNATGTTHSKEEEE